MRDKFGVLDKVIVTVGNFQAKKSFKDFHKLKDRCDCRPRFRKHVQLLYLQRVVFCLRCHKFIRGVLDRDKKLRKLD